MDPVNVDEENRVLGINARYLTIDPAKDPTRMYEKLLYGALEKGLLDKFVSNVFTSTGIDVKVRSDQKIDSYENYKKRASAMYDALTKLTPQELEVIKPG